MTRSGLTKYLILLLLLPVRIFVRLLPRSRHVWVFGSWFGERYADNSRYLFEHVVTTISDVTAVWISPNARVRSRARGAGGQAAHPHSWRGIAWQLRAGVAVVSVSLDDLSRTLTAGARVVQLWHGTPLKRIGRDDDRFEPTGGIVRRLIWTIRNWFLQREWSGYWLFPAPSQEVAGLLAGAFGIEERRMPILGYPRNDILLSPELQQRALATVRSDALLPGMSPGRLVAYLPTHRQEGLGDGRLFPFEDLDLDLLNSLLEEQDAALLYRRHFYHAAERSGHRHARIVDLARSEIDTQELLAAASLLVTDLSSCFFDYLLTDRPIVFITADLDTYVTQERGLYYEFEEVTPGRHCRTFAQFSEALASGLADPTAEMIERSHVRRRMYAPTGPTAASAVANEILARLAMADAARGALRDSS